jgi:hypothetical protein
MKKMQSLGKRLSKSEQKNVVGGFFPPFFQATCRCTNGMVEHTCRSASCPGAQLDCYDPAICATNGGLNSVDPGCTAGC